MNTSGYRYCGRIFTSEDIDVIRRLIADTPGPISHDWSVTTWAGYAPMEA